MEEYTTGTGQSIMVHNRTDCSALIDNSQEACTIHRPSHHAMRDFPTYWRSDRSIMERICPHGIGHPDPDDIAYKARVDSTPDTGVHGCDGCCTVKP